MPVWTTESNRIDNPDRLFPSAAKMPAVVTADSAAAAVIPKLHWPLSLWIVLLCRSPERIDIDIIGHSSDVAVRPVASSDSLVLSFSGLLRGC